jgi:glucose/arabinose dehydrogenase
MRKYVSIVFGITLGLLLFIGSTGQAQDVTPRTAPPDPTSFQLEPVVTGYARVLYVTHAGDGSGRLFLVQQLGQIHVIQDGIVQPGPFLDVSAKISADALGGSYTERGLLGLAFHPEYASNGLFFVNYTEANSHDTVVMRYQVSDDPNYASVDSGVEIFRHSQPYANHNGGHLAFGSDGYLYLSLGDGGSAGDPLNSGQQPNTLLGSILRIDVNADTYTIPDDNPFVGSDAGADEVWAYGLRNVWRFSFDRLTDDLYLADVGQNQWEEVNFQPAGVSGGQNYGWNVLEGTHRYSEAAIPPGTTSPIAEYSHAGGHCSITGGYVYRGSLIPELQGAYIFGDFCSGQLWSTYQGADGLWQTNLLMDTPYVISSFGEDEDGELYLVHYGDSNIAGQILRFTSAQ